MRLLSAIDKLSTFAPVLTDAAIRGVVVLLIALALTHALRRRNAAVRHLIWVGAILVQLLLPVFAVWGPKWNVAVPSVVASRVDPVARADSSISASPTLGMTPLHSVKEDSKQVPRSAQDDKQFQITRTQLFVALWAIGALFIIARLAIGTAVVARLARKGNRIDDGNWLSLAQRLSASLEIDRPLTLLRGNKLGVPVTWGIVYPIVLLPEDADAWPEERRRFVLVHEMAHVKRLDALTQLAGQFALAMFWFNPLVWIANRRMQMEREHACDDYVIRHGTTPSTYAEELLTMVRSLGEPSHRSAQPAFAALAMARRSEFEGRMLSILDPLLDRHPLSKTRTLMSVVLALLLVVPLAALQPYQRVPEVAQITVPVLAKKLGDEFPESFKVNITPSGSSISAVVPKPSTPVSIPPTTQSGPGGETVLLSGAKPTCDNVSSTSSARSTSIHADDDGNGSMVLSYVSYNSELCASATIIGSFKFSPNEDDVLEIKPGSRATFRERTAGIDREVDVVPPVSGIAVQPSNTGYRESPKVWFNYRRNGRTADFDPEARQWFAHFLPLVLTETGINVPPRVARWKSEGGVDNVLKHISDMTTTSARRSHYQALLDGGNLSANDLDKVVRSASVTLDGSASDMRAILMHAAPKGKVSRETIPAIERALKGMQSSGDQAAVAQLFGQTDDRDMLLAVMRVAATIESSGDRARVLQVLAPRYLAKNDRELEKLYFEVVDGLPSPGDQHTVLVMCVPYSSSTSIAAHIIQSSRTVRSSGDRASVMIALVSFGGIINKSLRDAFFDAAAGVPSDGDRASVLQAAAGIRP